MALNNPEELQQLRQEDNTYIHIVLHIHTVPVQYIHIVLYVHTVPVHTYCTVYTYSVPVQIYVQVIIFNPSGICTVFKCMILNTLMVESINAITL